MEEGERRWVRGRAYAESLQREADNAKRKERGSKNSGDIRKQNKTKDQEKNHFGGLKINLRESR